MPAKYPTLRDYLAPGEAGARARLVSLDRVLWLLPRMFVPVALAAAVVMIVVNVAAWAAAMVATGAAVLGLAVVYAALKAASVRTHRRLRAGPHR